VTLYSKVNPLGHRTKREITIEDFRGLGKLVLPEGTHVMVNGKADGASIFVDAYLRPDAVFYGVRIDADAVEPPLPET
jgi:hypothetical protein